jgi:methionyl aminopeptidase
MLTRIKTAEEIEAMREGGRILAAVLQLLKKSIVPGMITKELADIAAAELERLGGVPSTLGYHGFPEVMCISVNDEVVHGIPSKKHVLNAGDVVGLDLCVTYKGMITDAALSVIVGTTGDAKLTNLLRDTETALHAGIAAVHDGVHVGDIAAAVQAVLEPKGYGIVRDLVGHGVGHELHEEPNIPNYGRAGKGPMLHAGMTIAIEPMATLGKYDVFLDIDQWTIKTRDGSWAAHFEHTVLVTEDGAEILTSI